MKSYFTFLLLITLSVSCSKNKDDDCGTPTPTSENFLASMQVGDKLFYSMLVAENYYSGSENDYSYTGDTLELEVLDINPLGVVISQRITAGSNMLSNPDFYYWQKDSVYVNTWRIEADSLFIVSEGPYFSSHLLTPSRLELSDYSGQEVEIIGWRTTYDYSEQDAGLFATNFTLFGHYYDTLNVYINNEPMSYDGLGSTTIYSKSHGIVRTSVYGGFSPEAYGWDRIW